MMKIKTLFSFNTLTISFPFGKTIFIALLILPILFLGIECLIRIFPIPPSILIPSIDRVLNYSEIDIKFSRLATIEKDKKINCILLGNSMIDFGLNPTVINSNAKLMGIQNPLCFNMGLESMMPITSSALVEILNKRIKPLVIILGISPIDFSGNKNLTEDFLVSPWFRQKAGIFSLEGWLIDSSEAYKYWLSFRKYRNPDYRSDLANMNMLIDPYGFQIREKDNQIYQPPKNLKFPNFSINQSDLSAFQQFINQNSTQTRIIILEMPIHPDYLPYILPGGEEGYKNLFINPIENILVKKGIPFIRTQPQIRDIVSLDGWIDFAHLNEKGANQLSYWLANEFN